MPEGLLTADGAVAGAVHDDRDHAPEPSASAPRGWCWDRTGSAWKPRQRGPVLWKGGDGAGTEAGSDGPADPDADTRAGAGDQRDPDPGWLRDEAGQDDKGDGKLKFADVPKQVKDDIAGFAGLIGTPILAMLQTADPFCGAILAQSFEGIVDAPLPLICRS